MTTALPAVVVVFSCSGATKSAAAPLAVTGWEMVIVVAVKPVMIAPAGMAELAVKAPPEAMFAVALLLMVNWVALVTPVIVVPAGIPTPVTTMPTPSPAVAVTVTVLLPAVVTPPARATEPPTPLTAEPTVRPLVLATVITLEPTVSVPVTGTGPKVVARVVPASTPTPDDKVIAVAELIAAMVVPTGMLALPRMA